MRKKIVAGNWKMNLNKDQALALTSDLVDALDALPENQRVMVCPPSIHLSSVAAAASGSPVLEVGGQNMHQAGSGAYTGEISGSMLKSYGINSVLLGHSERRAYVHEDNALLREKVDAAFKAGCLRFDGAIQGFGGCPMAKDDLTGNMPTEKMISYFTTEKIETNLNVLAFESAHNEASKLFSKYH